MRHRRAGRVGRGRRWRGLPAYPPGSFSAIPQYCTIRPGWLDEHNTDRGWRWRAPGALFATPDLG